MVLELFKTVWYLRWMFSNTLLCRNSVLTSKSEGHFTNNDILQNISLGWSPNIWMAIRRSGHHTNLNTVHPVAWGLIHLPQSGHCVPSILLRANHEQFILGHLFAKSVHLGVDKHGPQMLNGDPVLLVLVPQGGCEALHVGLWKIERLVHSSWLMIVQAVTAANNTNL